MALAIVLWSEVNIQWTVDGSILNLFSLSRTVIRDSRLVSDGGFATSCMLTFCVNFIIVQNITRVRDVLCIGSIIYFGPFHNLR